MFVKEFGTWDSMLAVLCQSTVGVRHQNAASAGLKIRRLFPDDRIEAGIAAKPQRVQISRATKFVKRLFVLAEGEQAFALTKCKPS